jgi:hypothetical protein
LKNRNRDMGTRGSRKESAANPEDGDYHGDDYRECYEAE